MAEQQGEQEPCWRVVVHERNAAGWWTLCRSRYSTWAAAQQHAMAALRPGGGASNAGVYPERDGQVELPGWIKVRAEEEQAT